MHAGVSMVADRFKDPLRHDDRAHGALAGHEAGDSDEMQYTWAAGLFAIVEPARKGTSGQTRIHHHGHMDRNARSFGSQTNKKIGLIASDEPDGGVGTCCSGRRSKARLQCCGIGKESRLLPWKQLTSPL